MVTRTKACLCSEAKSNARIFCLLFFFVSLSLMKTFLVSIGNKLKGKVREDLRRSRVLKMSGYRDLAIIVGSLKLKFDP